MLRLFASFLLALLAAWAAPARADTDFPVRPITIIVEVMTERTSIDALNAMKSHFAVPEVQQCYYVTGEVDFVLVLTVATMQEYEALARRLFAENPNVKWFKTIVALDRVKVGLEIPCE